MADDDLKWKVPTGIESADGWPESWTRYREDPGLGHSSEGFLTRVIKGIPGVHDATVKMERRAIIPDTPGSYSFEEGVELADMKIEVYPCVVVDLVFREPGSLEWEYEGEGLNWRDLVVLHRVSMVLEDSVPAGVQWAIKQEEELMPKNELPSFRELARKVPDIGEGVLQLMEFLDMWSLRSMEVETDRAGNFKSRWDPRLAPAIAKPQGMEKWTVLLLEFIVPSEQVERYTSLVRSASKMTSKLGKEGSITHSLEETVRTVSQENDEVKWAAAAYKEIAEDALHWLELEAKNDGSVSMHHLQEMKDKMANESMANVGALFHRRFQEMERAVHARRPEVAADLLRGLDDD